MTERAAWLRIGLVRGQPFVDGKERTGFLATYVFLWLNGLAVAAEEAEVVSIMQAVALWHAVGVRPRGVADDARHHREYTLNGRSRTAVGPQWNRMAHHAELAQPDDEARSQ